MKTVTIKFKEPCAYLGRNGMGKCTGLSIDLYSTTHSTNIPFVEIYPINSKDMISRCYIEIPQENVSEVCAAMQGDLIGKILDTVQDRLPTLLGIDPSLDIEIAKRLQR